MRFFFTSSVKTFQATFKFSTINFIESIPATFSRIENAIVNASFPKPVSVFNLERHFFYPSFVRDTPVWVHLDLVLGSCKSKESSLIDH